MNGIRTLVARAGAIASLLAAGAARAEPADFQGAHDMMPFDEEIINYNKTVSDDPIARLIKRLERGETKLQHDDQLGWLPALLKELRVPESSQMLVGTRTSLQRYLISPDNPRALYYGDDVYIGFIPGAPLIELTGVDAKMGGVFYTLDQDNMVRPRIKRDNQCLECHASFKSLGVPGHLIRSHVPDEKGNVDLFSGKSPVTHRTPLEQRWGGWYVSGTHGDQVHMGNLFGPAAFAKQEQQPNHLGNVTDLAPLIDVSKYPLGHSDIVALMVFEHQAHGHNFITRIGYEARIHLYRYQHVRYLKNPVEGLLRYLLFADEVALTAPIRGTTDFAQTFAAQGPRDPRGRSLRDLDLQTRLFKHPCSYLIYSEAFDGLPQEIRDMFYRRLWEVLTGQDTSGHYERLTARDRRAIREILLDTKPDLPDYWRQPGARTASSAQTD